jgi:sugar phosphate isomerase/epimerase
MGCQGPGFKFNISVVVPLQDPTPLSPLPLQDLNKSIAKVARAGYDGVELAITNPRSVEVKKIKRLLAEHNLKISAITTGQAYWAEGISLTGPKRQRAIQRIKDHMTIAHDLEAVVIIGLIRGEGAKRWLVEALKECASHDPIVKLALEPLNRYETALVNNVDEALEVLDIVGMENVGILFDTFHANIEEASIKKSILKAADRIFYVHIADSNRWAPGYGHLNFAEIIDALCKINYKGFLSAEVLAKPTPDESLKKTVYHLREVVK